MFSDATGEQNASLFNVPEHLGRVIFVTCAGAPGEQEVYIFTHAAGEQGVYISNCATRLGSSRYIFLRVTAPLGGRMYVFIRVLGRLGRGVHGFCALGARNNIFICACAPGEQDAYILTFIFECFFIVLQ